MHRLPMYQHHCLARLLHSTRRALIILLALALLLAGIGVAGQVFFCLGPPLPRALAAGAGLEVGRIDLIEGRPEYLRFAAPTDLLGWLSA
ncbi:MAG: hypothetical protein NHG36_09955, partial [Chromatiaceae bacterium]|nr:hypothetical protein [Candidatus Thioaporhodococcus sediminis]